MSTQKNQTSEAKYYDYFNTNHLKSNLKQRSVRGGVVTITAQASKFILKFGSTAVLARLLVPEDYGLIGMATVVVGFVEYFKDLGLSAATIQRAEINHKQVSTLFWINLGVSCLVALIVALLAPAIANFYHEPRLKKITLGLAINFIFGGLTVQHQALLRRQMQFTSLAKIEVVSMTLGVFTAIIAAYSGLRYWALVLMLIAIAISNAIGVWLACGWRPGLPSRNSGVLKMLAFGGNLTGFNLVNYFSRNLDNVLIGRRWGSQELGLYAQAYKLVLLPIQQINNPISSVALPTLASLQSQPEKYCRFYYQAMLSISTLGMPIIGFLFASANDVILLLLGEQWLETVPIFKLLMPAAFNATIGVGMGWAYQSLGNVGRQFRWGIVSSMLNAVLFFIGVRWGAIGVAAVFGLSRPFFLLAGFTYCFAQTPLKLTKLISTLSMPTLASIGAAIILSYIKLVLPIEINTLMIVLIDLGFYTLLYLLIWILLPNGRKTLWEMVQLSKVLRQR
ncbi:lipopolysaccharide biosynthesis protein [Pleurocapsa sp. PCC 7319]|uniref:lipopolysaccharide biosynthesis protein n=1 Tax=Pleurocapsa sp. PCC 7319 TaxID=118161 RepID=UPI0003463F09|nr:lipopolysaccharide biosynthesis protein [Pleurocapsa sp. PCC 7319]